MLVITSVEYLANQTDRSSIDYQILGEERKRFLKKHI